MISMEQSKGVVDALAVSTTVAAIVGWLPAIAALFTIVWTAIRIYETQTIQKLLGKLKKERNDTI